jgi:hypothetical protein
MAKYIQNLTFHILNNFLSLSPVGVCFPCFLSVSISIVIMNTDSSKYANISIAIHIMKMPRRSPVHIHDVAGNLQYMYYPHRECV